VRDPLRPLAARNVGLTMRGCRCRWLSGVSIPRERVPVARASSQSAMVKESDGVDEFAHFFPG